MFFKLNARRVFALLVCAALFISGATLAFEGGYAKLPVIASAGGAVLIIDAGHGGEDGGAQSDDGLLESVVNLDIALRLEALCDFWGVSSVMTRQTYDIAYPDTATTTSARKTHDQKSRVQLINSIENATLISIHQNKYPDARPRGAQVLYGRIDGSRRLGELMHQNLISALYPENRRVAAPISDTIYLLNQALCPAVLVECGFLSNLTEVELLKTDVYKTKLATVILGSYMQYSEE